ncbi:MAG: flavodoxin-dependent (E)-4-hydroxy-3-methylbut-2-enyl-diphosphate synthase [Thermoanaerobacteraceae bacterium]|nr:flavodoxin-dependent (E)-4-hydroxy-3-methylbut-2-enyl-diphosphate synthase [Thermoanaerobacteraceae bacterium]
MHFQRRHSRQIKVGNVAIGGDAPVSVQSMTNTDTRDVDATVKQIKRLSEAGCQIVRVAVPDEEAAEALSQIVRASEIPVIADIHFNYRLALKAIESGVHGLRLNPGNIGNSTRVKQVVERARDVGVSIRIGVNAGSLKKELLEKYGGPTPEAMVESALEHVALLEKEHFYDIKISLKASHVPTMIAAYQLMAEKVDYPLHVGVTEAGLPGTGAIKSAVGIGSLLAMGIGDTIRVSLTGDPVEEVKVGYEILRALGLVKRGVELIACPTCGRCQINLAQIAREVEEKLAGVTYPLKVAVMGCAVNGPGEAKEADVGIAGGRQSGLIFRNGKVIKKVPQEELVTQLMKEIDMIVRDNTSKGK